MHTDKKKILIVEDQNIIALDLKRSLSKRGYKIVGTCDNANDAVELTRESNPDLIVMDIMLNGKKNGIETAGMIKKEYDIPVIFLTALTDVDTYLTALNTKPFKYLMKPVEIESLDRVIREIFDGANSSRV